MSTRVASPARSSAARASACTPRATARRPRGGWVCSQHRPLFAHRRALRVRARRRRRARVWSPSRARVLDVRTDGVRRFGDAGGGWCARDVGRRRAPQCALGAPARRHRRGPVGRQVEHAFSTSGQMQCAASVMSVVAGAAKRGLGPHPRPGATPVRFLRLQCAPLWRFWVRVPGRRGLRFSSTCRRRRFPIDGTSIQDPVAEVVRSRRRARIGAIHPGAGSVGAEAPARPGSADSAIQLSAAAGHHGDRSAGTRIDARICDAMTRIRRSVPRPHCRHTVMSIPVRRSIIASGVSGSPGVGRKHLN